MPFQEAYIKAKGFGVGYHLVTIVRLLIISAAPTCDQSTNLRPEPALGATPTAESPQEPLALMKALVTRRGQRI